MTFRKILCPVDFSEGSRRALHAAIRTAREQDAELVIAHAFHIPPSAFAGEFVFPSNTLQDMLDWSTKELHAVVRTATDAGVRATGTLLQDMPWSAIVDLLERQGFDLCIIGTHGRTGLARVVLGSVAEKVVRHAHCNVLVVRPDADMPRPTHALVPTDFSPSAEHALDTAAELVGPEGTITLLHVIEPPVVYTGEVSFIDYTAAIERSAGEALQVAASRIRERSHIVVKTSTTVGSPGAETLRIADADPTIDIVVMGSHGRTGLKRLLLGSVAEKIVRHARTPVLVARPDARS